MKPVDSVASAFERIEAAGSKPAWIALVDRETALKRAQSASGPLAGMTFAVKDNIDVAGMPTTAGCPAFAYQPQRSATVVTRLEQAGAVLIGKTNLDQFATGLSGARSPYGTCASVFNDAYISGGSSSGSAVAVARGQVDFALGTDTAGSGRVPAAFNGLIGMKPTRGVLSMSGVVPACRTLDCVSIFARTPEVAVGSFRSLRVYDEDDPFSRVPRAGEGATPWCTGRFRFGVPPTAKLEFFGDDEARVLFDVARKKLEALGGEAVEIDYEPFQAAANLLYSGPWVAERYAAVGKFVEANPDKVHPVVGQIIAGGAKLSAEAAFKGAYELARLKRITEAAWVGMDVMLLPTTGTIYTIEQMLADPIKLNTNLGYYTNFVNLLDLSAVAVPAGLRANGLPFGVTFIAPAFADEGLLALASRWAGAAETAGPARCISVAVVGAHLTGQPLNHQLTSRGARLLKTTRTAASYRFYALKNTTPPKPGLVRVSGFAGKGIELEIWSVPEDRFGAFVAEVPPPLAIGNLELEGGEWVKGFVCEPEAISGSLDITETGGWRNWLASKPRPRI